VPNWPYLLWAQYNAATSKERIEARKLCDQERARLANLGGNYLYLWTVENTVMTDIESGVAMPSDGSAPVAPRPRGRPRKDPNAPKAPATSKRSSQAEALEAALNFVAPVHSDLYEYSQFVSLSNNMVNIYNGQLAAGHPIVEELTLNPHLIKLQAALKRCGKSLAITETDAGSLSIKGENLRAIVPCIVNELAQVQPDIPQIEGNFNVIKEGFKVCGVLAKEDGEKVIYASILLGPNTCSGTNGFAMLQFWHGIINLPPDIVVPKAFAAAIASCQKNLTGIGGTWDSNLGLMSSVTFWFEGGAWLKTQCYNDRWPNLAPILDIPVEAVPIAPTLIDAITAVDAFLEDHNIVYFENDFVQTHKEKDIGAQYNVPGLIGGKAFNAKVLKDIAPYINQIDLTSYGSKAMFFGGSPSNPVRGSIMGIIG
jgi:hypothetical protein